jgi:hypothetical protein
MDYFQLNEWVERAVLPGAAGEAEAFSEQYCCFPNGSVTCFLLETQQGNSENEKTAAIL